MTSLFVGSSYVQFDACFKVKHFTFLVLGNTVLWRLTVELLRQVRNQA